MGLCHTFKEPLKALYLKWKCHRYRIVTDVNVEVDSINPKIIHKGFGLVFDKKLVLKDKNPLIFSTKKDAENYKIKNQLLSSRIIYQIWNPSNGTVNIGEVRDATTKF